MTRQLEYLTAKRLISEATASPKSSAGSKRAVASLTRRIRYLRSLLIHLARINPSFARRLAPELRALQRLLGELRRGATRLHGSHHVPASDGPGAGGARLATILQPSGQVATRSLPALIAKDPMTVTPRDAEPALSTDSPSIDPAGTGAPARAPVSPSAAPARSRLLTPPVVSTGPSKGVSAAPASAGTAAGTLVTMCVVCLCLGMLFARLKLIVLPWRLAVLGHRLERPG